MAKERKKEEGEERSVIGGFGKEVRLAVRVAVQGDQLGDVVVEPVD